MKATDVTNNPDRNELRLFACLQLVLFAVLTLVLFRAMFSVAVSSVILSVSAAIALLGIARPSWVRPVHRVWMMAVRPVGWMVSHLCMAMVYFLIVTPIGVSRRYLTGDSMRRAFEPDRESYWERRQTESTKSRYFRQF
ncbi:MAG: SxtJ family membrane protein [Planctomycetota bacterium]